MQRQVAQTRELLDGVTDAGEPWVVGPDRTIDFLFHAPSLTLGDHSVRRDGALDVSDHLPVMATYDLPGAR